jgi:UDP-3-O-[3-hydroxymyristoyl] glucosamine N-acyltransferase
LSVNHGGGVRLEEGSQVQSNACVDCALFGGETRIGKGSVIDNLVHIAHNVQLGENNRVIAGAMVAGSVQTGDKVWIGPMASVSSELKVGNEATVSIGAVVTRDVPEGARFTGNFAIPHERFLEFLRSIR